MPSMSYCAFENTATEMDQCVYKIQDLLHECQTMEEIREHLANDHEYRGLIRLIRYSREFLDELEYMGIIREQHAYEPETPIR